MSTMKCDKCQGTFDSRDLLAMHMLDHSFSTAEDLKALQLPSAMSKRACSPSPRIIDRLLQVPSKNQITGYSMEYKCDICQLVS